MRLPKKYQGFGLYLWCNKEKKTVTKNPCKHKERLVFQSRILNPITKRQDIIKTWNTKDPKEAFASHMKFKEDLQRRKFVMHEEKSLSPHQPKFVLEATQMYFDYMTDESLPEYSRKNLSNQYIKGQQLFIERFLKCLGTNRLSDFPLTSITSDHINIFHKFLVNEGFSDSTYNDHMNAVRYFFRYLIVKKGLEIVNPVEEVKTKKVFFKKEIITEEEFQTLLGLVDQEHGYGTKGKKRVEKVNYYRDWMKGAFLLAILTGERLDGIVHLQWKHVHDNFIVMPNLKVNRKEKTEEYQSYTFVSEDLAELLLKLNPSDPNEYILVKEWQNRGTLKKLISKAFTHYWRQTKIEKQISFKHMRKTYLTRVVHLIGDKARTLKHTNDETALKHYLNEKEIASRMKGLRMYNFEE